MKDRRIYSYVQTFDAGFAPNPFGPYLTLATCMPKMLRSLSEKDWVIGTTATRWGTGKLIYAMEVTELVSYQQYWNSPKYAYKKPNLQASIVKWYGDNIYKPLKEAPSLLEKKDWEQQDSRHSNENGTEHNINKLHDLSATQVAISDHYYYFGAKAIPILKKFKDYPNDDLKLPNDIVNEGIGHKCRFPINMVDDIINWITDEFKPGIHGDPYEFGKEEGLI